MVIDSIYDRYQLMGALRSHQYRVAAVAVAICDHISIPVDRDNIIAACLLHDMGNILKFDLDLYPEFLKPEGRDYWQTVQESFLKRYGYDEHVATRAIAAEILDQLHSENTSTRISRFALSVTQNGVMKYIHAIGFSHAKENAEGDDFSAKIAAYADMRVTPFGVTSMADRLADGKKRFYRNKPDQVRVRSFAEGQRYLQIIEKQIFSHCSCGTSDINDQSIAPIINHLKACYVRRLPLAIGE